jgi:DNA-binding IclR family transcriptional regulator
MGETAKTVNQALALLEEIAEHGPGTVSELARRLCANRTVVHRLLVTLERRGYVRRGADGYELGVAVLKLAGRVGHELREAARPALEALAIQFGETAVLSVRDGDDAVAVEQVLGGDHMVVVQYRPGFRHELTRGAHGRALLAFADPAVAERLLRLAPDGEEGVDRLRDTRARGYAVSHDELVVGASGLAAPVSDARGQVVASIGVVTPVHRFPEIERLAPAVLRAAASVAARLGPRPRGRTDAGV